MTHRFARFLLLFAALWLPVQTMAALSMSQCRHAHEQVSASAMDHDMEAADGSAMHCHDAADSGQAAHQDSCDNCEMCHLASAGFMPSAGFLTGSVLAENHHVLPAITAPPSHIAEPPQHPPRRGA